MKLRDLFCHPWATKIASLTLIIAVGCWMALGALIQSIWVPTHHMDGAFQTASGLHRLDMGYILGKDFVPYLGIGPLVVLYPTFKLFGATLCASCASALFVTWIVGAAEIALAVWLVLPKRSFFSIAALSGFFFAMLLWPLARLGVSNPFEFASMPGNSLKPLRSAAPWIAAYFFCFLLDRVKTPCRRLLLSAMVSAGLLLWSNDFALPTAGLFGILLAFSFFRPFRTGWKYVLLYGALTLAFWLTMLSLLTLGHPGNVLRYNFVDVAGDQWWYFEPYREDSRVFSANQVLKLVSADTIFGTLVLASLTLLAMTYKDRGLALLAWIGTVVAAGGCIASVGGHLENYFFPFVYWAKVAVMGILIRIVTIGWSALLRYYSSYGRFQYELAALAIAALFSVAYTAHLARLYRNELRTLQADTRALYVKELGGYLHEQWQPYIAFVRQNTGHKVVEEYWGIWSATQKCFSDRPVDSIIHALGSVRPCAQKDLEDAEYATSTRYKESPGWQAWGVSENFWFYDPLVSKWAPVFISPTTVVWKKMDQIRPASLVATEVLSNKKVFRLAAPKTGYYRVKLKYRANGGKALFLVRNNINVVQDSNGYLSMNPATDEVIFPVWARVGENTFDTVVVGNTSATVDISDCEASMLEIEIPEVLPPK
jgi:hypothetical protein